MIWKTKKRLTVKYHNVKSLRNIIHILNALSFFGLVSSFLLWLITFNDKFHTLHKLSGTLGIIHLALFICFTMTGVWLFTKEKTMEKQLGIRDE